MRLSEEIFKLFAASGGELRQRDGEFIFTAALAERKAFLTRKKLVYSARIAIDEGRKELIFAEALKETGFGLWAGGGGMTPGSGFKKEIYKTSLGPRQGSMEEQSSLFGKTYNYSFDFSKFRRMAEELAGEAGYAFRYRIF